MIHFDLPKQKSSIIKVLGVGGGGSNAVNHMFAQEIENVDFIICNTDVKALEQSKVPNKIQLGPQLTQGLGAGANPAVGKQATEESLEEIKRILEVNTKMAFVTAGMGGGTGTGGAPIISKICRDLGVLTVGIVTTPFGFEGPRRLKQAEEGIRQLQPYVDTLLVISNDKLRMQYGDLKMRDAFSKADNVLATAAKCITDIINSRGHIIVDFADVCTVMKNGGVAILGSAAAEGENRAQKAIEDALNSPLLNDSEIFGAKWILININSAEGDHECTMDEMETISHYLRSQAGPDTDVIVGMGYDNTLDRKIGITLIATGFEHKDPFAKAEEPVKEEPKEEKIVMTLGVVGEEKKMYGQQQPLLFEDKDPYAPRIIEEDRVSFSMPVVKEEAPKQAVAENKQEQIVFELKPVEPVKQQEPEQPKQEVVDPLLQMTYSEKPVTPASIAAETKPAMPSMPATSVRPTFLSKPMNIYSDEIQDNSPVYREMPAQPRQEVPVTPPQQPQKPQEHFQQPQPPQQPQKPAAQQPAKPLYGLQPDPEEAIEFTLSMKEDVPAQQVTSFSQQPVMDMSEEEDQRRRAADRINKLRNISFNMNTNHDVTGEFDNVPAYVRRNMELFGNTLTSVENYYSKYSVKKDDNNNQGQISTINKFLDEKKPD